MDISSINEIRTGIDNLISRSEVYKQVVGDASDTLKKDFNRSLHEATLSLNQQNSALGALSREFRQNHLPALRTHIQSMKEEARSAKVLETQMKMLTFQAASFTEKMKMVASAGEKVGRGIGSVTNFLKTQENKLGDVRKSLLDYNRQMFEVSRQAQVFGRQEIFTDSFWDDVAKNTNLSKIEFLGLHKAVNELYNGIGPTQNEMEKFATSIRQNFGGSAAVIDDVSRRLYALNDTLPGLGRHLTEFAKGARQVDGQQALQYSMALERAGTSMRELIALNQLFTKSNKDQNKLLGFENAVQDHNRAIQDANVNMGQTSETALIAIEKSMTKLVVVVDKLAKTFKPLTVSILSLKTIGMGAVVSFAGAVQGLSANFRALSGSVNMATSSTGRFRMSASTLGKGMMVAGAVSGVAGMAYNDFTANRSGTAGESFADKQSRLLEHASSSRRGIGRIAGGIIGGVGGGLLGGPMGVAIGSSMGSGVGSMLSGIGGMSDEQKGKMTSAAKAFGSVEQTEKFKRGLDLKGVQLKSENDILNVVKMQATEEKRILAIDSLIKSNTYSREQLNGKLNQGLLKSYDNQSKSLDILNKQSATVIERIQKYREMKNILSKTNEQLASIAQLHSGMVSAANGLVGSHGTAAVHMAKQADAMRQQYMLAVQMEKLQGEQQGNTTTDMARQLSPIMQKKLGGVIDQKSINQLSSLAAKFMSLSKQLAGATDVGEVKSLRQKTELAEAEFSNRAKALGVADATLEKDEKGNHIVSRQLSTMLDIEQSRERQERLVNRMQINRQAAIQEGRATMSYHEGAASLMQKQRDLTRARVELEEASAAGFAMSFRGRKQMFDMLVQETKMQVNAKKALEGKIALEMKSISGNQQIQSVLKNVGISMETVKQAGERNFTALEKVNSKMAEIHSKGTSQSKLTAEALERINTFASLRIEKEQTILGLQTEQVKMAMSLREGYLDVINEMTTGADLVSKLLPDAQRGIVSLHEMQMIARGEQQGGAMRRGFVSVTPFKESTDVSRAARYTQGGFQAPEIGGIAKAHINMMMKGLSEEIKAGGPKHFGGQRGPEQSGIFGGMFARGGRIPGAPSDQDNMAAMVNGRTPIRVASGEYIVNARATQRHLPLLEEINGPGSNSDGFASGGLLEERLIKSAVSDRVRAKGRATGSNTSGYSGLVNYYMRFEGMSRKDAVEAADTNVNKYHEQHRFDRFNWKLWNLGNVVSPSIKSALGIGTGFDDDHLVDSDVASKVYRKKVRGRTVSANRKKFDHHSLSRGVQSESAGFVDAYQARAEAREDNLYIDNLKKVYNLVPGSKRAIKKKFLEFRKSGGFESSEAALKAASSEYFKEVDQVNSARFGTALSNQVNKRSTTASFKVWASDNDLPEGWAKRVLSAQLYAAENSSKMKVMSSRLRKLRRYKRLIEGGHEGTDKYNKMQKSLGFDESYLGREENIKDVNRRIRKLRMDVKKYKTEGYASGGLVGGDSGLSSLTMSGGLRIGSLHLNGRVIGQDVAGGLGQEWKSMAQNAYG